MRHDYEKPVERCFESGKDHFEREDILFKAVCARADVGLIRGFFGDERTIDYVNLYALILLGYTNEEYEEKFGSAFFPFVSPQDLQIIHENSDKHLRLDRPVPFKIKGENSKGEILDLLLTPVSSHPGVGGHAIIYTIKAYNKSELLIDELGRFEALLSNIKGGVELRSYTEGFPITYVNQGFSRLTGYSKADIESKFDGKHTGILYEPDAAYAVWETQRQLKLRGSFTVEYRVVRNDGRVIWVLDKGMLVKDSSGKYIIQSILTNITSRKRQELLLEQKSFELETLTNNIHSAIIKCELDEPYTITYANDGLFRMSGYTREQFNDECENSFIRLVRPNDMESLKQAIVGQIEDGQISIEHVHRLIKRDNESLWALSKGVIVKNDSGEREFHGIITDITLQKQQEEALQISEKRYEVAMQLSEVTVFDYDVHTKSIGFHWSDSEEFELPRTLENGVDELISRNVIAPSSIEDFRKMYGKIDSGAPFAQAVVSVNNPGGQTKTYEFSITNIFDKAGNPISAVGVKKDITEAVALKREREFARALTSGRRMIYEANVTLDSIVSIDREWADSMGIPEFISLSEMTLWMAENLVAPENKDYYVDLLSRNSIVHAFEAGKRLLTLDYRKRSITSDYLWLEKTVNIIKNETTGDISIRCYVVDISDKKKKEQKAMEEQRVYEAMLAKSALVYEFNLTKNLLISGNEAWEALFGITPTTNYSAMFREVSEKAIHPEDRAIFNETFFKENIFNRFGDDQREFSCEYRRPDESGEFIWVSSALHVFEDPTVGEVKGFIYVENVDARKKEELELIRKAEYDSLTGFLNKSTTEKRIEEFLSTGDSKVGRHAFLIIDIDHFKLINDNFGHAFGDAVLSQISDKIGDLFRDDDIVGRIGGDEFAILMKDIQNYKSALSKAQEICDVVPETYQKKGKSHRISASVGIAFYGEHGKSYNELYEHSDSALYVSKRNGRNGYCVYSNNSHFISSAGADIRRDEMLESRSFDENITEYAFRIMYESKNKVESVASVLELVGKHYDCSRVYIYENSDGMEFTRKTFEWCAEGIVPLDDIVKCHKTLLKDYIDNFNDYGVFYVPDFRQAPLEVRTIFKGKKNKCFVQVSIVRDGRFLGFVGFDECRNVRAPSKPEITDYRNIANVLSIFLREMRSEQKINSLQTNITNILSQSKSQVYICDPESYKLLYINPSVQNNFPNAKMGEICHEAFWKSARPCKSCPIRDLMVGAEQCVTKEILGRDKVWYRANASWVEWENGQRACLIEQLDITEQKAEAGIVL